MVDLTAQEANIYPLIFDTDTCLIALICIQHYSGQRVSVTLQAAFHFNGAATAPTVVPTAATFQVSANRARRASDGIRGWQKR
jgi:hypothetical protein